MSTIGLPPSLLKVEPPAELTPLCQERLLRNRRASPSIRKCSRPTLMVGPATLRSVIRCKRRVHMCGSIFSTAGVGSSGGSHRRRSAGHPAACFGMDVMMMDEGFESESMLWSSRPSISTTGEPKPTETSWFWRGPSDDENGTVPGGCRCTDALRKQTQLTQQRCLQPRRKPARLRSDLAIELRGRFRKSCRQNRSRMASAFVLGSVVVGVRG